LPDGVTELTDVQLAAASLLAAGVELSAIATQVGCTVEELNAWVQLSPAFMARVDMIHWLRIRRLEARAVDLSFAVLDQVDALIDTEPEKAGRLLKTVRLPVAGPPPLTAAERIDAAARRRHRIDADDAGERVAAELNPFGSAASVDDIAESIIAANTRELAAITRRCRSGTNPDTTARTTGATST
jgi:hypothetical protein